ncbi:hypothetical protein DFP72DRAFT_1058355 [Ephemerocybe angulata]|uniref:DUF6593 domain-containing protein n=1 Tax=Ephemerocybe angulata TaxID=980116 RepID=A0A8H6IJT4_9AGAR|nr:hypothetical protein DFP72DRAFT_1058355 [Tulosesus angulatus]
MKFILADDSTPFSTFFRTEDDQPAYRTGVIAKNRLSGGSTVTIHKLPLGQGAKIKPEQSSGDLWNVKAHELATFKIRGWHPDEFEVNGKAFTEKEFFKKSGLGWYGRDRIWAGPDGGEYRWKMGDSKPELYLNDKEKTLVAKFHREHSGFLGIQEKRPPCLEIFGGPHPEALVDMIVITFVYMEKNRADREEQSKKMARGNLKTGVENLVG